LSDITFVFRHSPHATSVGREGLDALLASSAYSEELCAVFMDDGVTQLLVGQDTTGILSKDYAPMFKLLELYDINEVYVCADSLKRLGVDTTQLCIEAKVVSREEVTQYLHAGKKLLSF
jgi:tRNA 2-thiouridine synthesizing protein C